VTKVDELYKPFLMVVCMW